LSVNKLCAEIYKNQTLTGQAVQQSGR
jgi:hypothetical protein